MVCLWLTATTAVSHGQFLSRAYYPLWIEDYENYAVPGYRDALQPIVTGSGTNLGLFSYGSSAVAGYYVEQERSTYDPFGNYLVDGLEIFRLEEYRTLAPDDGSLAYKSSLYGQLFQNLVVAQDDYRGWSSRFIVGDAVRTKFTPLTLDLARLNGVRWDAASHKSRFSVVASKVSDPVPEVGGLVAPRVHPFSSYLIGGRWEATLGDVLTIGTTLVSLLHVDSMVRDGAHRRGVVPSSLAGPRFLYVVIADDSPEDGSGALVHEVQAYVNGERSPIMAEARRIRNLLGSRAVVSGEDKLAPPLGAISYLRRDGSWPSALAGYFSVLNSDASAGPVGLFASGDAVDLARQRPVEVGGSDLLVLRFEGVPADAKELEVRVLAANDYSIEVASGLGRVEASTLVWPDWHTVRRAPGNVQDESNLRWVEVRYGFPTGVASVGLDARTQLLGATFTGEVVRNASYYRFPAREGKRHTEARFAYYGTLLRPVNSHRIGVEGFGIPADFETSLPIWSQQGNAAGSFEMVDDNDDRDEWADSVDLDGVYPGLDLDGDGVIDTNVNNNSQPDYLEPFLSYHVDPDDFVFGDDYNHNGIVDARENDSTPDYPYRRDSRGWHAFIDLQLGSQLRYTVGAFGTRQPVGGAHNRSLYGTLDWRHDISGWGAVRLANRTERVQDRIADDLLVSQRFGGAALTTDRFSGLEGLGQISDATNTRGGILDGLRMKDSAVNTLFAQVRYTRVPHLNVVSSGRYEVNLRQAATFSDGTGQPRSTEHGLALVHKADYTWHVGNVDVVPMHKVRYQHLTGRASAADPDYRAYQVIPVLKVDYHFTDATMFRVGFQGFPHARERYRELTAPQARTDALSQVFVVQNRGNYSGYDLFLNMGYRRTERDFRTRWTRHASTESEYFVQVAME